MELNIKNVTLLSADDIFGSKKCSVIRQKGYKSAITDYAIALGGFYYDDKHVSGDKSLRGRVSYYSTVSKAPGLRKVNSAGDSLANRWHFDANIRNAGIRPVLECSNLSDYFDTSGNVYEIEYGEYPQYAVSDMLSSKLEKKYLANKLSRTGKTYTTDSFNNSDKDQKFKSTNYVEYLYGGKKYVRMLFKNEGTLSNGRNFSDGDYVWIEVSPIKWYVDLENNRLISKNLLASGVRFYGSEYYYGDFEKTEMYMFLNSYFKKEIIPSKTGTAEKVEEADKLNSNIEKLIREIYKCIEGSPDMEKYESKIEEMTAEYNERLDKIKKNIDNNRPTLETLEGLNSEFESRFSGFLSIVEVFHEAYKKYFEMSAVIDKYIDIINNDDEGELSDELAVDLETIRDTCLPFLKEEDVDRIKKKLIAVFNRQKHEITEYIKRNTNEIGYTNMDEMVISLREKIHSVLIELSTCVNKRDVEREVRTTIGKIIKGLFDVPKNEALSFYLVEINNVYTDINALLDGLPSDMKREYKQEILDIMNMDIDYSKDFIDIAKDLRIMWLSLNKVLCKIMNYFGKIHSINESYIDLGEIKR